MIISIRLKNFFSLRDDSVIDFTCERRLPKDRRLAENIIEFSGDSFVNIIGIFGSNAAGKSNFIKAVDFCRNLVLNSHLNNEGTVFDYEPFKFENGLSSEFYINFVTGGIEYEYSFELLDNSIVSESLYYFPNKRKSKVFCRENTYSYSHRKGTIQRPTEIEANTSSKTLFLSRASSMNRQLAQNVYRFFLNEMTIGSGNFDITTLTRNEFNANKRVILEAFSQSDSDIIDIELVERNNGTKTLQSYHRENPLIAFDFEREESEGTKRLLSLLLLLIKTAKRNGTVFIDEFDLKLHLRLAEFVLDAVRASHGSQLVFTSHNTALINTENLLREQIVFVNKRRDGSSDVFPVSDFKGLKSNADIQKAYLLGRFEAVPYVGNPYPIFQPIIHMVAEP